MSKRFPKDPKAYSLMTEHQLQKQCVEWFSLTYRNDLMFAIPNGGHRNIRTAVNLKKEGVTPGIPDLFIARSNGLFLGLFIEMKKIGGVVRPTQKKMHELLKSKGYRVEVCRTFEQFEYTVNTYFKGLIK